MREREVHFEQPSLVQRIFGPMKSQPEPRGKGWEWEWVPDDCDFPFVDVGIVDKTGRVPRFRFLLDFLYTRSVKFDARDDAREVVVSRGFQRPEWP